MACPVCFYKCLRVIWRRTYDGAGAGTVPLRARLSIAADSCTPAGPYPLMWPRRIFSMDYLFIIKPFPCPGKPVHESFSKYSNKINRFGIAFLPRCAILVLAF